MAGGWAGSTRRERLPDDWPQRVTAVMQRDEYRCTHLRSDNGRRCGARATDVDHLQRGDDHRLANLAAKCAFHHRRKTAGEGNAARTLTQAERRAREAGAREQHPGVLPPRR